MSKGKEELAAVEEEYDDEDIRRVEQYGFNRIKDVGIHTIEIYYPQFYFKQEEMEEYDAHPDRYGPAVIGKYTKGIGQIEGRFCVDDEDPISFGMTAVHRLMDRMERENFNTTYMFSDDGEMLPKWNCVGRLDVGTESITDRSKSMKSYIMDLFERYGEGEANIEGVDMYNACYGGQAAGLGCVNWIESDRWDGRYAIAVATDISEADHVAICYVGAACTATLYYPNAPLAHTSQRATCILHRFDFFKPVGWHHMAPIVDGKYSIEAYMESLETAYASLRRKMDDQPLFEVTDYNVFHTGGGYHVVKKAFERMSRLDRPGLTGEERAKLTEDRLHPSVHLLKIIGPCHTVSSFLNIGSVAMSQWEKAIGKTLLVFTYGSGSASSMYQMRFDDLLWMQSLGVWKCEFYREAIYMKPEQTKIHQMYVDTWMKFDYRPGARQKYLDIMTLEYDVYYLLEIDGWGRRFYHRGGLKTGPLPERYQTSSDKREVRSMRDNYEKFGEPPDWTQSLPTLEEKWKDIEYQMTYDYSEDPETEIVEESFRKGMPQHKTIVWKYKNDEVPKQQGFTIENDGKPHTYQIIGTWTKWKTPQDMKKMPDGSFTFELTLGVNRWEQFHLIQDNDFEKKIYPAFERSWKAMPCVGPHKGQFEAGEYVPHNWMLDGRDKEGVPKMDHGNTGDKYLVTFKWEDVKDLTWDKVEGGDTATQGLRDVREDGAYYVAGSWTCWDFVPMERAGDGRYEIEVQLTPLRLEFQIIRDMDWAQRIYPDIDLKEEDRKGTDSDTVLGPDNDAEDKNWEIQGDIGDYYKISFFRNPRDMSVMSVSWEKTRTGPLQEMTTRYFLGGSMIEWEFKEMLKTPEGNAYTVEVEMKQDTEEFQIFLNKEWGKALHPDKEECDQRTAHSVMGPDDQGDGLDWKIGKNPADKARRGDSFIVRLEVSGDTYKVSWKKDKERAFGGLKRGTLGS